MKLKRLKKSLKKLALKSNLNNYTYFYKGGDASLFNFYKRCRRRAVIYFLSNLYHEVEYAK